MLVINVFISSVADRNRFKCALTTASSARVSMNCVGHKPTVDITAVKNDQKSNRLRLCDVDAYLLRCPPGGDLAPKSCGDN